MSRFISSVLIISFLFCGCSKIRDFRVHTETYMQGDGERVSYAVSSAKLKSESAALRHAKNDCWRSKHTRSVVVISKETVYKGKLKGKLKQQAELGGPLPPFTMSHSDFHTTIIYQCE